MDLSEDQRNLPKDEKSRKLSFYKRSNGLQKKAYELSILCDVLVCLICYGKDCDEPKTYPEDLSQVKSIIKCYQGLSKVQRDKRKTTISSFLPDQKKKAVEANSDHTSQKNCRLNCWSGKKLRQLAVILDGKMKALREKLVLLKGEQTTRESEHVIPKQFLQETTADMQKDRQSNKEVSSHIHPLASTNLLTDGWAMTNRGQCSHGPKIFGKYLCTAPPSSSLFDPNLCSAHDFDDKKVLGQHLLPQGDSVALQVPQESLPSLSRRI